MIILDDIIRNLDIDDKLFIIFLIEHNIFTEVELSNYNTIDRISNITMNHLYYHFIYLQDEIRTGKITNIDEMEFLEYFTKKQEQLLWNPSKFENKYKYSSNEYECIISSISLSHLYYYKLSLKERLSIEHKNKIMASFKSI